jgi:hypothetical protein
LDPPLGNLDVKGVYRLSPGEHPTSVGLNKFSKPPSIVPFNAP